MGKLAICTPLLATIRKHEAPKGYGQIYSGAKGVPKDADVTKMTIDGVLAFQSQMLAGKSKSTACGGYQFLRKTLSATKQQMGLSGSEVWTPKLQDRMAIHLMEGRGLSQYLSGKMTRTNFANNLAKEWASLPVVSAIRGGTYTVIRGQSYYAGDGLNKSFHDPAHIEALLDAMLKAQNKPVDAAAPQPAPIPTDGKTDAPSPVSTPDKPIGLLKALFAIIMAVFGKK